MRDHSKNIGQKVYFCSCYNDYKINEGILVAVDNWRVKIYCGDLNKVVDLEINCFNNVIYKWYPHSSWGYADKNVKKFYNSYCNKENIKKEKPKLLCKAPWLYTYEIVDMKSFDDFVKKLDIVVDKETNKYYNRYIKELQKFYNFFHEEKMFYVFDVDGRTIMKERKDFKDKIMFIFHKYYYEGQDSSKPFKIKIDFLYKPFGRHEWHINIHKFDKFVESYELVKGEKYNG